MELSYIRDAKDIYPNTEDITNRNRINKYLNETKEIIDKIDKNKILEVYEILKNLKGRLFILGVGGSAANASHAVSDFRKIMNIDAHTPTDNVAEFSARVNDDGWDNSFVDYLRVSKLNKNDCILVLSVSGGSILTSHNIVEAIDYGKYIGAKVIGIVGSYGGVTAKRADVCIIVPIVNSENITPHTEEMQSVILHLLVNL